MVSLVLSIIGWGFPIIDSNFPVRYPTLVYMPCGNNKDADQPVYPLHVLYSNSKTVPL